MSVITNYTELKEQIASWIMRPDLDDKIPIFIQFVEAELNRRLRDKHMVVNSFFPNAKGAIPLTARNRQLRAVWDDTNDRRLEFLSVHEAYEFEEAVRNKEIELNRTGPIYYSRGFNIEGVRENTITLHPMDADDVTVIIEFYDDLTPLANASSGTNWVLNNHPDVYLYGALKHSAPVIVDDDRIPVWAQAFEAAVNEMITAEERDRFSGDTLNIPRKSLED